MAKPEYHLDLMLMQDHIEGLCLTLGCVTNASNIHSENRKNKINELFQLKPTFLLIKRLGIMLVNFQNQDCEDLKTLL